ncbi:MAG: hypothetical protein KDB03_19925 [Planctomycetales bacterium]|nr:hypothetical protein [Planctomycetales bacterium]
MSRRLRVGEKVVFVRDKYATNPEPNAKNIIASRNGEGYFYHIVKYWRIIEIQDESVVVRTRHGRTRQLRANDPRLRRAYWWETLVYASRFPACESNEEMIKLNRSISAQ